MPHYPAIPVATARPAAPIQFTPAQDQSTVSHLRVTIEAIKPLPDGSLYMAIVCGELGFRLQVPALPGRPDFQAGQRYMLEYPKGQNPLVCQYTAIYPVDQKPADTGGCSMSAIIAPCNTGTDAVAMSSREIANVVESRHDSVKRAIERLVERGVISQPPLVDGEKAANGVTEKLYIFKGEKGKRDSIIVVAQLSPEFTARLVDRWQELEAKAAQPALPDFTNPAEAARAWAVQFEQREQLAHEVKTLTPKAAALDRITAAEGSLCVTDAAKVLGMQPKALFKWMHEHQWIYRRAGNSHWIGYQHRLQTGVLEQKATIVTKSDGSEKTIEQVLVTAKGLTRLSELLGDQA